MNGGVTLGFSDEWIWLIFVGAGLFLVLLELFLGVETSLDLVFIGSAFILGGLIAWPFDSWMAAVIITSLVCIVYLFIIRTYVKRWATVTGKKTNIDTIIGQNGIVLKNVAKYSDGRVKIGNQKWRAKSETEIGEGEEIVVADIKGNTLLVEKTEGGK